MIAMGTSFSRFILGSHRGREKTAELRKQSYMAACGREPGAGPGTWAVAILPWKVNLCRVWQENNEIRMVPESTAGHGGVCLSTVSFQRTLISQGTA